MSLKVVSEMEDDFFRSRESIATEGVRIVRDERVFSNENYFMQNMILEQFKHMSDEMHNRARVKATRLEWGMMAMIVDRVCFFIYLLGICGLLLATFTVFIVQRITGGSIENDAV